MTKYLFLYRSPSDAPRPQQSPADMQEAMAHWSAWKAKFEKQILDMGDALTRAGAVCRTDGVTDGPYIEGKEVIGGYMIVETRSLEEAIQIANEGPMMRSPGASIEIRALAGRAPK